MQPKFNQDLKDDKTFPYLEITTREDFPRVEFTRDAAASAARSSTARSPAPAACAGAMQVLQKIFKFRTCILDIDEDDEKWRWFRPCLLASIDQCTAPCNLRISQGGIPQATSTGCGCFWKGNKTRLLERDARARWQAAATALQFEKAARLRDEIHMLETLDERGELDTHVQPEVFYIDPKKGLAGLQKVLKLDEAAAHDRRGRHRPPGRRRDRGQPGAVHRRPAVQAGLPPLQDPRACRASTISPAFTRWSPAASSGCTTTERCFPTCC